MLPHSFKYIAEHVALEYVHREVRGTVALSRKPAIGFAGFQKQGKSTLINAIVQVALLPVNSVPATATTCVLEFGSHPSTDIYSEGQWRSVPFEDRASYMDQSLLVDRVPPDIVRVSYPANILPLVTLLDTPGLGSVFTLHSESLKQSVALIDLIVLVCSIHLPLSEADFEILDFAKKQGVPMVCAITKADEAADTDDPDATVERVKEFISTVFKLRDVELNATFVVSALENGCIGSPFERSVDSLREYLLSVASHSRIQSLLNGTLAVTIRETEDSVQKATMLATESRRKSFEWDAAQAADKTIEVERATTESAAETYINRIEKAIDALLAGSAQASVSALVPEAKAVNNPDSIPDALTAMYEKIPRQLRRISDRVRAMVAAELNDATTALGIQADSLSHLLTAFDRIALPELGKYTPTALVKQTPGFLAVSMGLHGTFVQTSIERYLEGRVDSWNDAIAKGFKKQLAMVRAAAIAQAATTAAVAHEKIRVVKDGLENELRSLSQQFKEEETTRKFLAGRKLSIEEATQVYVRFTEALSSGDPASVSASLASMAVPSEAPERALVQAIMHFSSEQFEEAASVLNNVDGDDEPMMRQAARLYWICRCRSNRPDSDEGTRWESLDPLGSSYYEQRPDFAGYSSVQRLVVDALSGQPPPQPAAAKVHVAKEFQDMAAVAEAILDPQIARSMSSARLADLGLHVGAAFLREQLQLRRSRPRPKEALTLALGVAGWFSIHGRELEDFAERHSEVLGSSEVEEELHSRFEGYATGSETVPPQLKRYLAKQRWRALACAP